MDNEKTVEAVEAAVEEDVKVEEVAAPVEETPAPAAEETAPEAEDAPVAEENAPAAEAAIYDHGNRFRNSGINHSPVAKPNAHLTIDIRQGYAHKLRNRRRDILARKVRSDG